MDKTNLMKSFLAAAVAGGIALSANAQLFIDDDFSYSSIDDFHAVWSPTGTGETGAATLVDGGVSIARQANANFHRWSGGLNYAPTDEAPLIFSVTMFDPGSGIGLVNSAGLRNGANPLFEMGFYNGHVSMYSVRFHNVHTSSDGPGWIAFGNGGDYGGTDGLVREEGWHTFTATIGGTSTTVTLDLQSNGTVDSTLSISGSLIGAFTEMRIGGPGGAAAQAGNPVTYGAVSLEVIPEPSTYAAIFGGLALVGAFVYRRRMSVTK